jgi:hypothetical protein
MPVERFVGHSGAKAFQNIDRRVGDILLREERQVHVGSRRQILDEVERANPIAAVRRIWDAVGQEKDLLRHGSFGVLARVRGAVQAATIAAMR